MKYTMAYPDAIEAIKSKAQEMRISRDELATGGEISESYLSRLLNLEREASDQILIKLAQTVKLDPLVILRKANRIPLTPVTDELSEQIIYEANDLTTREKSPCVPSGQLAVMI